MASARNRDSACFRSAIAISIVYFVLLSNANACNTGSAANVLETDRSPCSSLGTSQWTYWNGFCYSFFGPESFSLFSAIETCFKASVKSRLLWITSSDEATWLRNLTGDADKLVYLGAVSPASQFPGESWKYIYSSLLPANIRIKTRCATLVASILDTSYDQYAVPGGQGPSCFQKLPYYCQVSRVVFTATPCPDETWLDATNNDNRCFKFFNQPSTFFDAVINCLALGGRLAEFDGITRAAHVLNLLTTDGRSNYSAWAGVFNFGSSFETLITSNLSNWLANGYPMSTEVQRTLNFPDAQKGVCWIAKIGKNAVNVIDQYNCSAAQNLYAVCKYDTNQTTSINSAAEEKATTCAAIGNYTVKNWNGFCYAFVGPKAHSLFSALKTCVNYKTNSRPIWLSSVDEVTWLKNYFGAINAPVYFGAISFSFTSSSSNDASWRYIYSAHQPPTAELNLTTRCAMLVAAIQDTERDRYAIPGGKELSCFQKAPYYCQISTIQPKQPNCSDSSWYDATSNERRCFKFFDTPSTFFDAMANCMALGGSLAEFDATTRAANVLAKYSGDLKYSETLQ